MANLRLGAKHLLSRSLAMGAGLFSDRSPSPPPDRFASLDIDYYGATLGFEVTNRYELRPQEPRESLAFSSTVALRYAYGNGRIGAVRVAPPQRLSEEPFFPRNQVRVHEIALHLGSALYF